MEVSARAGGSLKYTTGDNYIAPPQHFQLKYRSPEIGLLNLWELWGDEHGTALISIRGTVNKTDSWLANFYAAMVPAKGQMVLTTNDTFRYELAQDPKAAVHVGWLISMAYICKDLQPKLDSLIKSGTRDIIITGHSQGGGISFLLTAWLQQQRLKGMLPADLRIKTYCTAAPKPGNLYFAYEYEQQSQEGWAYNVVNPLDWVPEAPVSIQTMNDFNDINPFKNAKPMIRKQKFPKNLVLKHVYNKLVKPPKKAQCIYEHYLGKLLSKEIGKRLKGIEVGEYYHSNDYVRTGNTIVLKPDSDYLSKFPADPTAVFMHHFHHSYLFLIDKSVLHSKP